MKTEQEQIKAIKQIIDERVETTLGQVQGRHDNVIKTVDTVIIARDIVNAGYGDVSEYKAEIEQLNIREEHYKLICDVTKATKKQAQIDALNNVKDVLANQKHECLGRNNLTGYSAICDCEKYIDDLIKEVEK